MSLKLHQYAFHCYDTLKEVSSAEWQIDDMEIPHYASYEFLLTIEEMHSDQFEFKYLIIKKGDQCIGLIYLECIIFSGTKILPFVKIDGSEGFLKMKILKFFQKVLPKLSWNLLSTGNTFLTGDAGIYLHDSLSQTEKKEILESAFKKAVQNSEKKIHALMMNNVYDDMGTSNKFIHEYIKAENFAAYMVDPDMDMHLSSDMDTFEKYLSALTSKYRVRAKKVMKLSLNIETRDLELQDLIDYKEHMYKLYRGVADKVDFNIGWLAKDYFLMLKSKFNQHFFVKGYFLEDELIGYYSYFKWNYLMVHFMGMDYEHNRTYKLYNRMLLDMVWQGIEYKSDFIHFGRTATEIKSTVGALPRTMKVYIKHRSNWKTKVMKRFESSFGTSAFQYRKPFKK